MKYWISSAATIENCTQLTLRLLPFRLKLCLQLCCLFYPVPIGSSFNSPITAQEILDSISSFQPVKSPGSDGFPIEFYREYADLLVPRLLDVYLRAFQTGELPTFMCDAIIVLPKPGKNPLQDNSYRPISLLQSVKS